MKKYDFLIIGCGLYGACFASLAKEAGRRCLILEKRDHIAGNCFTQLIEGIQVHTYGAHIFHTSNKTVWDYAGRFTRFNSFINSPLANYRGEIYPLPFNMNTFHKMWGVTTADEAKVIIEKQRRDRYTETPRNLEEQAINLVGTDIYETLIRGYTEKQWGRPCTELPPFIIRRIPVRFTYDNNYFNDLYQGIPENGYTAMIEAMTDGVETQLNTDYLADKTAWDSMADTVIYTGPIDTYYQHCFGPLEYRSLRFETETLDIPDYQGNAVVNYTSADVPYTRVIEHKHFAFGRQAKTVVSREYSHAFSPGAEPYYPVNDDANNALYERYRALATDNGKTHFCGRLGEYQYYDMDKTIERAMALAHELLIRR